MNYPDPNYAPPPNYDVESGTNCENAKPYRYWKGAFFCEDVTIATNLTIDQNLLANTGTVGQTEMRQDATIVRVPLFVEGDTVVRGYVSVSNLQVQEIEFKAIRLPPFDNYYVLAAYIPS